MINFNLSNNTKPKIHINIGALLDIPTGSIITGRKGETIINGGLGQITGVVGPGNNYKSTILHYMMLSAASKVQESTNTAMATYDTEVNVSLERLDHLSSFFGNLPDSPTTSGKWSVTDKSVMAADKWASEINKYMEEKSKDKKAIQKVEGFTDPYTKKELEVLTPTFVEIDSLTEFEPESTMEMLESGLDSSDTNTYFMKQGLFKTKFITTLPRLSNMSNTYFLVTAHIGEKINMATGPAMYQQPTKKLQYLKSGDTIKGVSSKFQFLLNNAWFANTATQLVNQNTKLPEYPKGIADDQKTDLNLVKLTQLRGKNGGSGYTLELVVSQVDGVLPSLTEFHFIKENGRYGLGGSVQNYYLELRPDVSLMRTTVRKKLEEDKLLARATNITAELLQLKIFHPSISIQGLYCEPKELYEDIKKLGYDWDVLLDTRGYWTLDQYKNRVPFLSTIDLLKIRKGLYHPYFLDDKKKLKAEYVRK